MVEMFSYPFMQRALIAGLLICICAALVGVSLVLRRNSMIGDGLSHTAFSAFALATVFGFAPLWFALPIVIIASFFVLRLSKIAKFMVTRRLRCFPPPVLPSVLSLSLLRRV